MKTLRLMKNRTSQLFLLMVPLMLVGGYLLFAKVLDPKPAGSSVKSPFSVKQAMVLLFGNYDESQKASIWSGVDVQKLDKDNQYSVLVAELREAKAIARVRVYSAKEFEAGGKRQWLLYLTSVPPSAEDGGYGCRACPVLLGGVIFEQRGRYWAITAQDLYLGAVGESAEPPLNRTFVRWGPQHYGLLVKSSTMAQGYESSSNELFAQSQGHLATVFSIGTGASDCGAKEDASQCVNESTEITFVPGPNAEYYDLRLETTTMVGETSSSASHAIEIYGFDGARWVDRASGAPVELAQKLRAANRGDSAAMLEIGGVYSHGELGLKQDYHQARSWYERAAVLRNPTAMNSLALLYANGDGVEVNPAESIRWLRLASEGGSDEAGYNLGRAYHDGEGVGRDYEQALKWYRSAADAGHAEAMNDIGVMYCTGTGVKTDEQQAIRWFMRAVKAGSTIANKNLASVLGQYEVREVEISPGGGGYRDTLNARQLRDGARRDMKQSLDAARETMAR